VKHQAIPQAQTGAIIKLAILAVGGQGGGVLTDWIVQLAQSQDWWAQATSVAGVAQRTGATIYYIEMAPRDPARPGQAPVFALAPAPGDVDILIAAELAEAGRAILRGFVTAERTTLIAARHRMLAVAEKVAPGDARADPAPVLAHAAANSRRLIAFDMDAIARRSGAYISASLFGALAGSGALPFPRTAFEATIRAAPRGADASLKAFAVAADFEEPAADDAPLPVAAVINGPAELVAVWGELEARAAALPAAVAELALPGLRKVVDYQDLAYGREYLDRLDALRSEGDAGHDHAFARAAAKHLANAMAYDDLIRVADLKTRAARGARVRAEANLTAEQTLATTEYFHPRMAEVCATLPSDLGGWIEARPRLMRALDRVVDRGRRIRSDRVAGFAALWLIAGLKPRRRGMLRHRREMDHIEAWLARATQARDADYALGVEVLNCRRLIKGYSDTHARGLSKFDRVLSAQPMLQGRPDPADWLRRLREAALKDEAGTALDGAIRTIESFAGPR
jgi:indolepyruvate ferredoxin oxidoreductase beta subunit